MKETSVVSLKFSHFLCISHMFAFCYSGAPEAETGGDPEAEKGGGLEAEPGPGDPDLAALSRAGEMKSEYLKKSRINKYL